MNMNPFKPNSPKNRLLAKTLFCSIFVSTAFVACGPNVPPSSAPTTPLPSSSASVETPAEVPTAPPTEASPSPEPSPTPEPTVTPFPSGTPMPSITPIPTPSPIYGESANATVDQANVLFRARVITDNREVLPVIKGGFVVHPYNLAQIQQDLLVKNKVEAKPVAPQQSDAKYQLSQKVCTTSGCSTESTVDMEVFNEDLSRYQKSILPEWESRAYAGLEDAIEDASNGRKPFQFSTDANGEAALRVSTGMWYFNGRYTVNGTVTLWESIPFLIQSGTKSVELTR